MKKEQSDLCRCLFSTHVVHCYSEAFLWSSYAPHWSKRVHDFVGAGFLTQQLSWASPHHSTPAGPCLYCTCGLKHDGLVIQADGFGEDTAGQRWTAAPAQPTISNHNYRITCRKRNQAEYQDQCSFIVKKQTLFDKNLLLLFLFKKSAVKSHKTKIKPGLKLWAIRGTTASAMESLNCTKARS